MPDRTDTIEQLIEDPSNVTVDGTSVTSRSMEDVRKGLALADEYARTQATNRRGGKRSGWAQLAPAYVVPPGGV